MVRRNMGLKALLKKLSAADLRELLEAKAEQERKKLPKLRQRLEKLQAQVDQLNGEIAAIEGVSGGAAVGRRGPRAGARRVAGRTGRPAAPAEGAPRRRGRGRRKISLREAIVQVLSGAKKPMGPAEIRDELIRTNLYGEPTKTFYQQIVIRLSQSPDFVSLGKGKYKLR